MATVYLIAQPSVKRDGELPDLKPLYRYGEVKVILTSGEYPSMHPKRCLDLVEFKLKEFNKDEDYIAWGGGDTLAVLMVGALLERLGVEDIRWLKYVKGWVGDGKRSSEKGAGYYREVKMSLWDTI